MRTIRFSTSHVLDAWSEHVHKDEGDFNIDYIKLENGVLITITENSISVYDADDLDIKDSGVSFNRIKTRLK